MKKKKGLGIVFVITGQDAFLALILCIWNLENPFIGTHTYTYYVPIITENRTVLVETESESEARSFCLNGHGYLPDLYSQV